MLELDRFLHINNCLDSRLSEIQKIADQKPESTPQRPTAPQMPNYDSYKTPQLDKALDAWGLKNSKKLKDAPILL